jgi:hypothetical protein
MSFDHKAFSIDWRGFQSDLAPILYQALSTGDARGLVTFVDSNLVNCADPYEGDALEVTWRNTLESGGVQEVADFALTKFYDPGANHGLSNSWLDLEQGLPPGARGALLGTAFGPSDEALFDPGLMGSYFQTPEEVRESLALLEPLPDIELAEFVSLLRAIVDEGQGLYVTF